MTEAPISPEQQKRILAAADRLEQQPELRFKFILARDLGMTVAELDERLGTDELDMWTALYALESRDAMNVEQGPQLLVPR